MGPSEGTTYPSPTGPAIPELDSAATAASMVHEQPRDRAARVVHEAVAGGRVTFHREGADGSCIARFADEGTTLVLGGRRRDDVEAKRRLRDLHVRVLGSQPSALLLRVMLDTLMTEAEAAARTAAAGPAAAVRSPDGSRTPLAPESHPGVSPVEFVRDVRGGTAGTGPRGIDQAGTALAFDEPEPWPEPVEGSALLDALCAVMEKYLVLPSVHALVAVVLWILHTWTWETAEFSPRLIVAGPKPRCGKSRLFEVIGSLVRRALLTSSLTPAVLYRVVQQHAPTVLIDEFDSHSDELREALRSVLNAGQRRGGAVVKCVGDDHEPRRFLAFSPVAIAGIGRMPDTVEDRGIRLAMRRRKKREVVQRLRLRSFAGEVADLRRRLCRWADDHRNALEEARPALDEALDDRANDGWEALFAIADTAGHVWSRRAREAAAILSAGRDESDDSIDTSLLADVRDLFGAHGVDRFASERLSELLGAMKHRPWSAWGRENPRPISAHAVARLLRPFEIRPRTIRLGADTQKGYLREWFEDTFERYLPPDPSPAAVTSSQLRPGAENASSPQESQAGTGSRVTSGASPDSGAEGGSAAACDGVTGGKGETSPFRDVRNCGRGVTTFAGDHPCPGGPV